VRPQGEQNHADHHDERRDRDLLQGLGTEGRPADRVPSLLAAQRRRGTLKTYPGFPHGMCTTHPDVINPDQLAFIKG
jgi:hypothetical protein